MCPYIYFNVYGGHSKFVCEFMFLMYLVMEHMHWIDMSVNIDLLFGVSLEQ